MKRRSAVKAMALSSISPLLLPQAFTGITKLFGSTEVGFKSNWENWPDMKWIGPEFWGNRLQDWEIINGKACCVISAPNRTLHILTHQLGDSKTSFQQSVTLHWDQNGQTVSETMYAGFRLGAKGRFEDYRSAAVFGEGLDIGINGSGKIRIGEKLSESAVDLSKPVFLSLSAGTKQNTYTLKVKASNSLEDDVGVELAVEGIEAGQLEGNLALVAHASPEIQKDEAFVSFSDWVFSGEKITENADQLFGPICFAQYTLHDRLLKLTAQLAPIEEIKGLKIALQIKEGVSWKTMQSSEIDPLGRIAQFRIQDWQFTEAVPYRVYLEIPLKNKKQEFAFYGEIAAEPKSLEDLKVAVFSCNADHGFPDEEVSIHVNKHQPDMALFLGDQFYEGTGGFGIQTDRIEKSSLDYLRKWYMFGWSYREIFRNIPAAFIPDDHDVYHGNVWGAGGEHAPTDKGWGYIAQDEGGYKMQAQWVNMVQATQTSHLPDPFDPRPVKQGINVYYTDWNYGGVSFAIIEDRKFKSAPKKVLPEEAHVQNGFIQNRDFDIKQHYDIDAELLGERQMEFLEKWASDWGSTIQMKAVCSQTNFCTVATLPEGSIIDEIVPSLAIPEKGEYVDGDAPTSDMDSNGWPQKGRDEALRTIRKAFALHIAGDQHLASTVHYGVDEFRDSGFAFAGPALNNLWPRRWWPQVPSDHQPIQGKAKNTGDFLDGFGNKMTIHAVANPYKTGFEPSRIYDRGTGYGIITFDKQARKMKIECWPRNVDPIANPAGQYEGWPIEISQEENYARKAFGYLPKIEIIGAERPVLEVFNEKNRELEYAIRLNSSSHTPKVFSNDSFRISIIDASSGKKITKENLQIVSDESTLKIDFS
ncbi:alkaline phosphatase D family protein [Algoriphagus aestuarii]|nr:alkaline phosphatase D family protein [Algoriphagus aestuarii]